MNLDHMIEQAKLRIQETIEAAYERAHIEALEAGELPGLPKAHGPNGNVVTLKDCEDYARQAIAADRAKRYKEVREAVPPDLTAAHIDRLQVALSDLGPATQQALTWVFDLARAAISAAPQPQQQEGSE